jgi:hypothetical protein
MNDYSISATANSVVYFIKSAFVNKELKFSDFKTANKTRLFE